MCCRGRRGHFDGPRFVAKHWLAAVGRRCAFRWRPLHTEIVGRTMGPRAHRGTAQGAGTPLLTSSPSKSPPRSSRTFGKKGVPLWGRGPRRFRRAGIDEAVATDTLSPSAVSGTARPMSKFAARTTGATAGPGLRCEKSRGHDDCRVDMRCPHRGSSGRAGQVALSTIRALRIASAVQNVFTAAFGRRDVSKNAATLRLTAHGSAIL